MRRAALAILAAGVLATACGSRTAAPSATDGPADRLRQEALRSARVWLPPTTPISQVNFADNPAGPWAPTDDLDCRLVPVKASGTTPKFECALADGEVVKVKYGYTNPEVPAEVAATRLLAALGFGADRMYVVHSVRCAGCPASPFRSLKRSGGTGLVLPCFAGGIDYGRTTAFDPAVVERHLEGRKIKTPGAEGWAWYELDLLDRAAGASPRALCV